MLSAHFRHIIFSWKSTCVRDVETHKDEQLPATVEMHKVSILPFPALSRENSVKHHLFWSSCVCKLTPEFSLTLGTVWHYFCSSCANTIYPYWNVLSFGNEMQSTEEPLTARMHSYWMILFMEIQFIIGPFSRKPSMLFG